ncbi:Peptidase family C69 [anaerobic digester metagenome]|uniref:Peptidase family C69 n=1 Tax=anaerobic digester metagenome TaxID=1263854 RepID=A0A485M590_9ZZZZ
MCDTFAVGEAATRAGSWIFAKNSDREPDEAQIVVSYPGKEHSHHQEVRCTYISIPQAPETRGVVLCKPFWIWGAEMGVNEKGVVIGNEALFTRSKPEKSPGLIGMDLVRLGLERADTAQEAADVITGLLRRYGQGGPCGYRDKKFTYMNSYLIMDRTGIVVLETVGRDYAMKSYQDFAAISNGITIGRDWKESSMPRGTDFQAFSDPIMTWFSGSRARRAYIIEHISPHGSTFGVADAFEILRGHQGGLLFKGLNHDVCMHAAEPLIRRSHTTGSLVVELDSSSGFRIFVTAGSSPCLTAFKPILPGNMPAGIDQGGFRYNEDSYWWRHEAFIIQAQLRLSQVQEPLLKEIREFEGGYCLNMPFFDWESRDRALKSVNSEAFFRSSTLESSWLHAMKGMAQDRRPLHNVFWKMTARRNGIPLE